MLTSNVGPFPTATGHVLARLRGRADIAQPLTRWEKLRRERKRHTVRYYWAREETFGTFVDTAVRYPRPDR